MSAYTKEQLIDYCVLHASESVRRGAAEALYQRGRCDAALSVREAMNMAIKDDKAAVSPPASSPKVAPTAEAVTGLGVPSDEATP